jgi:uncharacterized protein (DUF427 family)
MTEAIERRAEHLGGIPSAVGIPYVPTPKRIRAFFNGVCLADSQDALLRRGYPRHYSFPQADVRIEILTPTAPHTRAEKPGQAAPWTWEVDDRKDDIAWTYIFPHPEFKNLQNLIALYTEKFEEDDALHIDGTPLRDVDDDRERPSDV